MADHVFLGMLLMGGVVVGKLFPGGDVAQGDHVEPGRIDPQSAVGLAAVIGEVIEPTVRRQEQIGAYLKNIGMGVTEQDQLGIRLHVGEIIHVTHVKNNASCPEGSCGEQTESAGAGGSDIEVLILAELALWPVEDEGPDDRMRLDLHFCPH